MMSHEEDNNNVQEEATAGKDFSARKLKWKRVLTLFMVPYVFLGFHMFSPNFLFYTPVHMCRSENDEMINETKRIVWNRTTLPENQCHSFADTTANNNSVALQQCRRGWVFDLDSGETVVSEFNLVCTSAWKRPLLTSIFMIGMLLGSVAGGYLSDRMGRRIAIRSSFLTCTVTVFAISFVTSYEAFAILQFASGFLHVVVYYVSYVLVQEHMPKKRRNHAALAINLAFGVGFLSLPLAAFAIRNWRWFIRLLAIVGFAYYPVLWWFIPESLSWTSEMQKEEMKSLKEGEHSTSLTDENENGKEARATSNKNVSSSAVCYNPVLRLRILICCFLWNVSFLAFYTLNLNSTNLDGNIYVNCALAAVVDMASYLVMAFMLSKLGRRGSTVLCHLFSGILCLVTPFVREVHPTAGIACSMTGKFFVTISMGIIILYTGEVFPTLFRNTGVGVSSMSARFGGAAAPFLIFTGEVVDSSIPFYVMGAMSLAGAVSVLLLPETSDIVLPDSVEDAVRLDKNRAFVVLKRFKRREERNGVVENGDQHKGQTL